MSTILFNNEVNNDVNEYLEFGSNYSLDNLINDSQLLVIFNIITVKKLQETYYDDMILLCYIVLSNIMIKIKYVNPYKKN